MLAVADYLDALDWVRAIGGVKETIARSNANLDVLKKFVAANEWIEFLAKTPETLSNTSVCFIVQATPDRYTELARAKVLSGTCWTHPILANGLLYARSHEGTLVCLDLKP